MTALVSQDVGSVLDNYADVIEGGNSYRGSGTAYKGVPGLLPYDEGLRAGGEDSITVSGNGTTTTIPYASGNWPESRWVKDDIPGFWAIDQNDEARRITGWDNTAKEFTVDALTTAPALNDTIAIQQGFKRMALGKSRIDSPSGYDRHFELRTEGQGRDIGFSGSGVASYLVVMILALRILKRNRDRITTDSALTNLAILTEAMVRGDHRSGLVRALSANGTATTRLDDEDKIIVEQKFDLVYRISTTFK